MAIGLRTVQKLWRKAFSATRLTNDAIFSEYKAWSDRFMWQRMRLGLWIAIGCEFTFIVRDICQEVFHFADLVNLTPEIKDLIYTINISIFPCLLGWLILHNTKIVRRYPGLFFLCQSFSITLVEQVVATVKGFAFPDQLAWIATFLTQATLIPTRWHFHLASQLGVFIYYFVVNTVLKLKLPPPHTERPLYGVTLILSLFWICLICDLAVYLYERLQRSEFYARKELEIAYEKLGVAEAKYRSIFENAIEGIFQSTPEGRYITANPSLARIFGYSRPEEVTGNFIESKHQLYVNPNRRADFVRLIEEYGSVSEFESQIYRQDGSIVWISENAYAVRDRTGQLLFYEGMIEDITKRKLTEAALQEQFNFLQVLINTIPTPVYYQNAQGIYVGCNRSFEESLGLNKQQIIGRKVYDIAPKDLAEQYQQADKVLFEQGGVQTYESNLLYKDGKKHDVIFYKATFSKSDGTLGGLVGVILDISDRKHTEQALRVFFHAVSHDLRNPVLGTLMVLRNLLNKAEAQVSDSSTPPLIPVPRSILERMEQSSDRQLNLINSLMETHVNEVQGVVLQFQRVQLHTIVEAAIADLQAILTENQALLTNSVSAELPFISADPTQLWRVLSNLIVNAVKHNPPGLSITLNAVVREDKIYCTVSDNGVGLSKQQCARLFDLYFRGDLIRNSVGLGLGLYLCKQIITAHGGEIGVESTMQAGSTFWFSLPFRITAVGDK